jgi:hypothetical protein
MPPHYEKATQLTAIARGDATLLDHSTEYVNRVREIIEGYVLDHGGSDNLTSAQRTLIRRISFLELELEKIETRFATDPTVGLRTLDTYSRASSNQGRLLRILGIERKKGERPSLNAFLKARISAQGGENLQDNEPARDPAPTDTSRQVSEDQHGDGSPTKIDIITDSAA